MYICFGFFPTDLLNVTQNIDKMYVVMHQKICNIITTIIISIQYIVMVSVSNYLISKTEGPRISKLPFCWGESKLIVKRLPIFLNWVTVMKIRLLKYIKNC